MLIVESKEGMYDLGVKYSLEATSKAIFPRWLLGPLLYIQGKQRDKHSTRTPHNHNCMMNKTNPQWGMSTLRLHIVSQSPILLICFWWHGDKKMKMILVKNIKHGQTLVESLPLSLTEVLARWSTKG